MDSFLTPYGLSNSGKEKLQFTPFWGVPKPGCSNSLRAGTIESHNFFVLGPILVKFTFEIAYLTAFQRYFGRGGVAKKSCTSHHFTPYAN